MMNRRQMLMVFSAFMALPPLVGGLPRAAGAQANLREEDRILGDPDAPLSIIEYASLTCPHCANFHLDVLPQVKEEWIDSGRASMVYRHFPLDNVALSAALVAEAMPSDRAFFGFLNVLFDTQAQWSRAEDPLAAIARHAQLAGMDQESFEAALQDEAVMDRILQGFVEARDELNVDATPTLIVNGNKLVGISEYDSLSKALEEAAESS